MIRYRFGIRPLTRRDAYAQQHRPLVRLDVASRGSTRPELPDPPAVARRLCASPPNSLAARDGRPTRPKPHDFEQMLTSGYLERLGFDYKPATASSTFRLPSTIESLLKAG